MKHVLLIVLAGLMILSCGKDPELTTEEQLEKDVATIDKYLADHSITALSDESGLRYEITTAGTGVKPTLSSTVTVKYVGKFLDSGSIFDQSTNAVSFPLANLIKGWQIGFPLLAKGSKATLYIPSGLGYGKQGYPPTIPSNANLIFDVELIDVKN